MAIRMGSVNPDEIVRSGSRPRFSKHRPGTVHQTWWLLSAFSFSCADKKTKQKKPPASGSDPLRFSPPAGPVELAALKQPQAQLILAWAADVCDAQARDEGA